MSLVPPSTEDAIAWWSSVEGSAIAIAAWRAAGAPARRGEDGSPCLRLHRRAATGFIAVCDGLGGAGARPAWQISPDGETLSGAHIASNLASLVCHRWHARDGRYTQALEDALRETLTDAQEISNVPPPKFRGSAVRTMPTTLAAIHFDEVGGAVCVRAMWAGDSRCYVLTPSGGLAQVSVDDTSVPDALDAIRSGPPMTQVVGIDRTFVLHEEVTMPEPPVVLITATDGFFDYIAAPHQFELEVLRALAGAEDADAWAAGLARWAHATAGDDATLAAVAIGFDGFDGLKNAFADRLNVLDLLDAETIGRSDPADRAAKDEAREEAWRQYRHGYEALLPPTTT